MYLLDTNVLSALRDLGRYPQVENWIGHQRSGELFVCVVSIGEIERGIAAQRVRDPTFALRLASWLDRILNHYADRLLPLDLASARRWGALSGKLGSKSIDLQIAGIALERGLTVATRSVRDFIPTGVAIVNPFEPTSPRES